MMLWTALGTYMQERGLGTLIGCCSVALTDNAAYARQLWTVLSRSHLVAEPSRVTLRCGARVPGAPAHDAAFNTADFPMMLCLDDLASPYRQHFVGTAG